MNQLGQNQDMHKLDCCDFGVAYECGYKCRMCYFWQESPLNANNVLSLAEWKEIISQLPALPKSDEFIVKFSGPGEPLLRSGIFELVECAVKLGIRVGLISNAAVINAEAAKLMSAAGLEMLSLSLDSMNPDTHDFLRGVSGAQEKVIRAVEMVARYSPNTKIGINSVISAVNLLEIVALAEWADHNEKISHLNFQAVNQPFSYTEPQSERWFEQSHNAFLWPEKKQDVEQVLNQLINIKRAGGKISNPVGQLKAFREYFLNPQFFIKKGHCNLEQGNVLIIDPAGNVSYCSRVGIIDGFKNTRSLKEILSSPQAAAHLREISACQRNCHLVVSCYFEEEG